MSAQNTILIKRRTSGAAGAPPALSGGELAFNEVDSTLYYGANEGILSIAGSGAFVNRTSNQTISGDKTLVGSTTLGSTTFSSGANISAGNNKITSLGAPTEDSDASTKKYVDDTETDVLTVVNSVSSTLNTSINNANTTVSTVSSTLNTKIDSLSSTVVANYVEKTESEAITLNGGLTVSNGLTVDTINASGNTSVGGDLTVTGNLAVLGATTTIETTTTVASAFAITNTGSGPALSVSQTGNADIATFLDDNNTALIIKDGGNVGIGTATPNSKLTVSGNVSASGNFNGSNADFTGTLDADGAANLGSTLAVTGAATLNSTLAVTGAVTFSNNLSGNNTTSTIYGFKIESSVVDGGSF